ncbi:hypothetical protein RHGRI_002099 [Rhododendron griersonianum]|nr:hypothetical protein RHGRI_002099 [Rhododendron griersonianum]
MSLMIVKHSISKTIRGAMPDEENAKKFLSQIADRFVASEKVEACTLLSKFVTMRYNGKGNIREYIMEMSNIVAKMKALKLEFSEDILVFLILISLPTQFGPFKINYNTQREKWTLNELIAQCVQEEERMKQERTESAHLATHSHGYSGTKKRKLNPKANGTADVGTSQTTLQQIQDKGVHCFFCKKVVGHVKKDCPKYHRWLAKKGNQFSFVCCEFNLAEVPHNTWWIDTGTTIHISVSMQGCLKSRTPSDAESFIYIGDDNKVRIEAIGVYRFKLESIFYLDLDETVYVPSFRRNLISVSYLDKSGYTCSFGNGSF